MNVFFEFHKTVQQFQREGIEYALVGGVAVAFHAEPRFTRDIDFLIDERELARAADVLMREGYFASSEPRRFKNSPLTLHRFLKAEGPDEMSVGVLVAGVDRHAKIIADALEADSKGTGVVRVASRADLIWLKRQRNSKQDQAGIAMLEHEQT